MGEPAPLVLLATENPMKGTFRIERPADGVVAAITAGDGPSTNPKRSPNEDSLAVVPLSPRGAGAIVADAHFGPLAGEVAARAFAQALAERRPFEPAALAELVIDLDERVRAARPHGDTSETTALAVVVQGERLSWASVGDSRLFRLSRNGALARLTRSGMAFLGGELVFSALRDQGLLIGDELIEAGAAPLEPGDLILATSDGIDEEFSGLSDRRLAAILSASSPLEERVATLMREAGTVAAGGGRDNLAAVAIAVSST